MKARPLSDKARMLCRDSNVYVRFKDGTMCTRRIKSFRDCGRYFIVGLDGVDDSGAAENYRGATLSVEKDSIVLEEGEFFYDQVIGLPVFTAEGRLVGKITDIFETSGNDVYVINDGKRDYLIPAVRSVVKEIDVSGNRVVIEVLEGLLD
jgi:16S rRNA processing protein RimM